MGLLFVKTVDAFSTKPSQKIANKRLNHENSKYVKRVDLTYLADTVGEKSSYPYLHDLNAFKQLLPVPSFLLWPLKKYRLPYESVALDKINFRGKRTVIYIHGSGSISEDNSILHLQLLQESCDLIRIAYHIDYESEGVNFPKKSSEMLTFLKETEEKIAPSLNEELKNVLIRLKVDFADLFLDKEVILIGHSLGGGLAANLIACTDYIKFDKFINLDGTLMNPAIQLGLNINQLHLSQDYLFKKEWLDEENFADAIKAIGQDYGKKIDMLINNSTDKVKWIQIKDSSHFTFTDFPNLLRPYKMFKNIVGDQKSAARIRQYVLDFILYSDGLRVDDMDVIIKN